MGRAIALGWILAIVLSAPLASEEPWEQGDAFTATPQAILQASAAHPPREGQGILCLLEDVRISIDDLGCRRTLSRTVYRFDQASALKNWNEVSCSWAPWHQNRPTVRARVIAPDGRVHLLDPATLGEYSTGQGGDGLFEARKRLAGPLPQLETGAIVETETVLEDTSPGFAAGSFGVYDLWETVPLQKIRIFLQQPAGRPLHWKVWGISGVVPQIGTRDGRTSLSLEVGPSDPPPKAEANQDPGVEPQPTFGYSTCASWADVARGYLALMSTADLPAETRAALAERVGHDPDPRAALPRILAFLHERVRYTGVEFGSASIIPRPPAETLARGYGDCKDKACLLLALLRAAGFPARLALADSGFGRAADPGLPGLGVFDHAIVLVPGPDPLWIDATAEFARAGELPFGDQGRPALVIDAATVGLVRTPELEAAGNLFLETREVFLAEKGPARIVETSEYRGPAEMGVRRAYADTDAKELREQLENYLKTNYSAARPGRIEFTGVRELAQPFVVTLEAEGAEAGRTWWSEAKADLYSWPMLKALRENLGIGDGAEAPPARTRDLLIQRPYVAEWRYIVRPPPGFVLRQLPENEEVPLGPANLSRTYARRADGAATATFRLDTGRRHWTAAEVDAARKAIQALGAANRVDLWFDQEGDALLKAGRTRDALAAHRRLAESLPGRANPLVHHAQDLLSAGLGEAARAKLRQAAALDPRDADAQDWLGWTLQVDLLGRRFRKGWDREGSLAAYRKAVELDPRNAACRIDFATLLEAGTEGTRFGPGAQLDQAILQYRALADELKRTDHNANLLEDLGHSLRFQEALDMARALPAGEARNGWLTAAMVMTLGVPRAMAELPRLLGTQWTWQEAMAPAANDLVNLRLYPEARAMLEAAPAGMAGSDARLAFLDLIGKAARLDTLPMDPAEPRGAMLRILQAVAGGAGGAEALGPWLTPAVRARLGQPKAWAAFRNHVLAPSYTFTAKGLESLAALEVALSQGQFQVDGDPAGGYRVRARYPAREGGIYKQAWVFAMTSGVCRLAASDDDLGAYGREALARADAGDLAGARRQLDWARDVVRAGDDEDPLNHTPFPGLWTRGQEAGLDEIRWAAAALLFNDPDNGRFPDFLAKGLAQVQDPERRTWLLVTLGCVQRVRENWDAVEAAGQPLVAKFPDSRISQAFHMDFLESRGQWTELLAYAGDLMKRHPDVEVYQDFVFKALGRLGRYAERIAMLQERVAKGSADSLHFNDLAWYQLLEGKVTEGTLTAARSGVRLAREGLGRGEAQHTLASVLAELGKTEEALKMLKESMESRGLDEPGPTEWYVLGRIAENLEEPVAARVCYARVTSNPAARFESSRDLAARRLAILDRQSIR